MTAPDPGRVLRRALVAWGLGHLLVGRVGTGRTLLVAELVSILLIAWLSVGLADSSAYLVPYLAGAAFVFAWAWQAVDAYRSARLLHAAVPPTPARSPAASIGWLSLPLLVWGTGFWLVAADAATPEAVLDRFVTDWSGDGLDPADWPEQVIAEAEAAAAGLGTDPERFGEVRVRVTSQDDARASAVAEAIHYERQPTTFLFVFPGTELVPVADERLLGFELEASPVELLGGGEIGAVRWELVEASAGD